MKIVKSLFSLREKNKVDEGLFKLRVERNFLKSVLGLVSLVFVAFSFVDYMAVDDHLLYFFLLRSFAVVGSLGIFFISRGRLPYPVRAFLSFLPFAIVLQFIMIQYELLITPYFLGVALIIFPVTIIFPMKFQHALLGFAVELSPTIIETISNIGQTDYKIALLMTLGGAALLSVNASEVYRINKKQIRAKLLLQKHLKTRNEVIVHKVNEISRRKKFEAQYSPQVARAILSDESLYSKMEKKELVLMVFDVKSSTKKTAELPSEDYKYVVEDVFDIINTVCLKWDVTVDKFTGDGVQVFAGSPFQKDNDMERCLGAATEVLEIMSKKQQEYRLRWREDVGVRVGISRGDAFVGFIGKGFLKSFTAIGSVVSFTHRICGEASVNSVLVYEADLQKVRNYLSVRSVDVLEKTVSNLKGLENNTYSSLEFKPRKKLKGQEVSKYGKCENCETPLILVEDSFGIPKIVCEGCEEKESLTNEPNKKAA